MRASSDGLGYHGYATRTRSFRLGWMPRATGQPLEMATEPTWGVIHASHGGLGYGRGDCEHDGDDGGDGDGGEGAEGEKAEGRLGAERTRR